MRSVCVSASIGLLLLRPTVVVRLVVDAFSKTLALRAPAVGLVFRFAICFRV